MRQPTPRLKTLQWHRAALRGDMDTARSLADHDDDLQCGWYKLRYVKGGPWVPARIWLESTVDPETGELTEDEQLRVEIEGVEVTIHKAEYRWSFMKPISRSEFLRLTDAPLRDSRMADTKKAVDLAAQPTEP